MAVAFSLNFKVLKDIYKPSPYFSSENFKGVGIALYSLYSTCPTLRTTLFNRNLHWFVASAFFLTYSVAFYLYLATN